MLVMRPISPTSAWAMKPVAMARAMDQPQMTTTRAPTEGRSSGARPGATSFAIRLLRPGAAHARALLLFEEHWRGAGLRSQSIDEHRECVGEALPLRRREALNDRQDLLLRHGGGALQHGPSGPRQVEHQAARVARVAVARDQSGVDQA